MNNTRQRLEQRAVEAAQGKDRLEKSRTLVTSAIGEVTQDSTLPQPIRQLFEDGWRQVARMSHLRNGSSSPVWKNQLSAVQKVAEFGSTQDSAPGDDALGQLGKDIQSLLGSDSTSQAFVEALHRHLKPSDAASWAVREGNNETKDQQPEDGADPLDSTSLGRVKLLRIGEWICVPDAQGEERPVRLIWRSEDDKTLVFVNRTGRKVINFAAAELAQALESSKARILDNFDMPLLDRSWQTLLQKMHGELATEAVHDPLTGLLNRQPLNDYWQKSSQHLILRSRCTACSMSGWTDSS